MSAAFLKNPIAISRVLIQRHLINHGNDPFRAPSFLCNKVQSKPFFLRKPREYEISPSLFSSSFSSSPSSSSSSATAASLSKVGFVGWYLGMVKSWPILTKSVTSALIYTAADLSSQME